MILGYLLKIMVYVVISGMSLILIYHFIVNGKKSLLLYSFIGFQALVFLWAFHDIVLETHRILPDSYKAEKQILMSAYVIFEPVLTCFIPYIWLTFSIFYAEIKLRFRGYLIALLAIPEIVFFLLHFMNFSDNDVVKRIIFFIYLTVCYLYAVSGTLLIVRNILKQSGLVKKQAILLSLCPILPLAANIIQNYKVHFLSGEYEVFGFDITLLSFTCSMLFIAFATFKYKFLKTSPYAMQELFRNMDQPVVFLDNQNRIVEYNNSFSVFFSGLVEIQRNDRIEFVLDQLQRYVDSPEAIERMRNAIITRDNMGFAGELTFTWEEGKCFSVNIRPVFVGKVEYAGKIIVLNDISGLKRMIRELNEKNSELYSKNEQLKEYTAAVEALTAERVRGRMARDVHDTLGQSMTIINTLLSGCMISCEKDVAATKDKLSAAMTIARKGLSELRRVVSGEFDEEIDSSNLRQAFQKLIGEFEISGMNVDLNMDRCDSLISREQSNFLYRLCQEALTNSVRHGKAKNATVIIQTKNEMLRVFLSDDGHCSKPLIKGMGLTGMEQRAEELGGSIRYWFGEVRGFNIYSELPISKAVS